MHSNEPKALLGQIIIIFNNYYRDSVLSRIVKSIWIIISRISGDTSTDFDPSVTLCLCSNRLH